MLINYIKIAWRNLVRNRAYSLINIFGLSVGITSCLLIFLFIRDELSYDRYHENADRIYRITRHFQTEDRSTNALTTSNLLAPTLKEEIAGIEASVRLANRWPDVLVERNEAKFYEQKFFFTDPSIFEIFSFRLTRGNPETALERPFTVIISEDMARKYFGESNPVGKTLTIRGSWGPDEYEVTGILENVPHNSHFSINFLTSFETLRAKYPGPASNFDSWNYVGSYTYMLLNSAVTPQGLTDDLKAFVYRHQNERRASMMEYRLQPITDIHLYSDFDREIEPSSDVRYLYIFGSIALLILVIAGVNYVNLATAHSSERALEVGIRKTLGVNRSGLIRQFLSESFIFCFISMILAFLWAEMSLPFFENLTGKPLTFEPFHPIFLFSSIGIWLFIGGLAGLYPAFILSRFNPSEVFSGAGGGQKKSALRNVLVVFQFAVSIILITGTLVISSQMDHIRDKRLGITDETVVSLSTGPGTEFKQNYSSFKNRLLNFAGIHGVTDINPELPSDIEQQSWLEPEGFQTRIGINNFSVGNDFLKTLGIPLISGTDISEMSSRMESDSSGGAFIPVLVNETAAREWGWDEPLGKTFEGFTPTFKVVGVVEDFHYRSLKEEIDPLILWPSEYSVNHVLIRMSTEDIRRKMAHIENAWKDLGPGTPLDYTFLNDQFDSMYKAEDRLAGIFRSFTLLAIIIACLGLFGLAAFSAERRTKEIGIRKVLGATVTDIVTLLTKDFIKLVIIGFIIAVPISWYAMNQWLTDFAYKIEIGTSIFLLAGAVALIIALVTVSWQSIHAALANPVESLRSE